MRKFVVLFAAVALLLQAGTALADNQWGNNHWASDNLAMTVSDSGFDGVATSNMLDEWRTGNPLDPQFISSGKGDIVVTTGNGKLWFGRAQIWIDGSGHTTKGQVKMNTRLLAQYGYGQTATAHVLCQELGHVFGLTHTDAQSCMNDNTDFLGDYPSPSPHDVDWLSNHMYTHDDVGGGGTDDGGSDCPPKSRSPKCNAQASGRWVTVHTFWAPTHP